MKVLIQKEDKTGPRLTNKSPMVCPWSLQGCSLGSWIKLISAQGQQQAKVRNTYVFALGVTEGRKMKEIKQKIQENLQANILPRKTRAWRKHCPAPAVAFCKYKAEMLTALLRKMSADCPQNQRSRGRVSITPGERGTFTHEPVLEVKHYKLNQYWAIFLCAIVFFSVPGRATIIQLTGNLCIILTMYFWLGMKVVGLPIKKFCMKHQICLRGVKALSCFSLKGCKNNVGHIGFEVDRVSFHSLFLTPSHIFLL